MRATGAPAVSNDWGSPIMILKPVNSCEGWTKPGSNPNDAGKSDEIAQALAARWHGLATFPAEVADLLAGLSATNGSRLLLAIPEHAVPLAGDAQASTTHLWLLARMRGGLLPMVVEGNAGESFGPLMGDWGSRSTSADRESCAAICRLLEIRDRCDSSIRHRFLHRTACALIEGHRFWARGAAVIVHSFSRSSEGFADFQHFVQLMGGIIRAPGELVAVVPREGIELFFGWVQAPDFGAP